MSLKLLYPNEADRYWLLRLIIKDELKGAQMKEETLAARIGRTQPTISALLHVGTNKYRATRDTVLQVFARGFEKDPAQVDTLLWLFDGKPMTQEEIEKMYGRSLSATLYD